MTDRKKQNYLITQLVKRVPMGKIDTRPEGKHYAIIRQSEAGTGGYISKRRMRG